MQRHMGKKKKRIRGLGVLLVGGGDGWWSFREV